MFDFYTYNGKVFHKKKYKEKILLELLKKKCKEMVWKEIQYWGCKSLRWNNFNWDQSSCMNNEPKKKYTEINVNGGWLFLFSGHYIRWRKQFH